MGLQNNKLKEARLESIFSMFPSLEYLNLSGNPIEKITDRDVDNINKYSNRIRNLGRSYITINLEDTNVAAFPHNPDDIEKIRTIVGVKWRLANTPLATKDEHQIQRMLLSNACKMPRSFHLMWTLLRYRKSIARMAFIGANLAFALHSWQMTLPVQWGMTGIVKAVEYGVSWGTPTMAKPLLLSALPTVVSVLNNITYGLRSITQLCWGEICLLRKLFEGLWWCAAKIGVPRIITLGSTAINVPYIASIPFYYSILSKQSAPGYYNLCKNCPAPRIIFTKDKEGQ